ncbi:MAG: DUF484 family protein [Methyloprofundus sp.]|nr:DUF484 family protein [Methyloprofundus sp.]
MSELDSVEVEAYLYKHPDFFNEHLTLLEHMTVPHSSGSAVSLIAKQLELFRQRHDDMEAQLKTLIEVAEENDSSASSMHELTLAVLEAESFEVAIENLGEVLAECFFTNIFSVKIIGEYQGASAMADVFVDPECDALVHFAKEMNSNKASCGRPTLAQARFLFAENALAVKSCVIIPMAFTEIEGLIAIGSQDKDRFQNGLGDLFLTQMSEIIGTRFAALLKSG